MAYNIQSHNQCSLSNDGWACTHHCEVSGVTLHIAADYRDRPLDPGNGNDVYLIWHDIEAFDPQNSGYHNLGGEALIELWLKEFRPISDEEIAQAREQAKTLLDGI